MATEHVAMSPMQAEARLLRGRGGRLPRPRLEELKASGLLRGDPDLAWRSLALALLADELADE